VLEIEAVVAKALVEKERVTQRARTEQRHVPFVVEPQNLNDLRLELAHAVTQPTRAEVSEVGEVLAHLRARDAAQLRQPV
jgi:hypothetical protein